MKRLRIVIDLLFLTAVLVASLAAEPVAAAKAFNDPQVTGEHDIEVLRHSYFVYLRRVKADTGTEDESVMERRVRDADFSRHNYDTRASTIRVEVTLQRIMRSADFRRHNYGSAPWGASMIAGEPVQTSDDQKGIEYRQRHRR